VLETTVPIKFLPSPHEATSEATSPQIAAWVINKLLHDRAQHIDMLKWARENLHHAYHQDFNGPIFDCNTNFCASITNLLGDHL